VFECVSTARLRRATPCHQHLLELQQRLWHFHMMSFKRHTSLCLLILAATAGAPGAYLKTVKYQFYAGSNALWGAAQYDAEFAAMAAVRVKRVTIRNPLDDHWPNYSSSVAPRGGGGGGGGFGVARCGQNFTAFFKLGATLRAACGGCCRQYAAGPAAAQPLTLLLNAAAKHNISVVLGLAWSGSAPRDAPGLVTLAALQAAVAARLYALYGDVRSVAEPVRRTVVGAYTEVRPPGETEGGQGGLLLLCNSAAAAADLCSASPTGGDEQLPRRRLQRGLHQKLPRASLRCRRGGGSSSGRRGKRSPLHLCRPVLRAAQVHIYMDPCR